MSLCARSILILLCIVWSGAAKAEVYLTKEAALSSVFPKDCVPQYDPRLIDSELSAKLNERSLQAEPKSDQAHFFKCMSAGNIGGYALIDSEVGKHLPITYIVGISARGQVTRVEMMVFREVRGWEVRERKFMQQFEGKSGSESLKVGQQIDNISGATLSSKAIVKGVNRALFLWNYFYGSKGA